MVNQLTVAIPSFIYLIGYRLKSELNVSFSKVQEIATKLGTALQVGENLVWKDQKTPDKDQTAVKEPISDPGKVKEPEPTREKISPTPAASRPATSTLVEAEMNPMPDLPPTPAPNFPPDRDEIETPLPNINPGDEAPEMPPPTPTFHPPPGEPILQKRLGDISSLPPPLGAKGIPPLPFKLGGAALPPLKGDNVPNLDNLPAPPLDELPSYEEVEMADKLSGKKKKQKEKRAELEPL